MTARSHESTDRMILIGIGGNLWSPLCGQPIETCRAAVSALGALGISVLRRSRWYRSIPVSYSNQPDFINGVVQVATTLSPIDLLSALHHLESQFGRVRGEPNAARVLDLDLLVYGTLVCRQEEGLCLPHPRMHERAFVLKPLAEVAPDWRHPVLGFTVSELLGALLPRQLAEPIE